MTPEFFKKAKELPREELVKIYLGTKLLFTWWQQEIHDFDEDMTLGRFASSGMMSRVEPVFRRRLGLLVDFMPTLESYLNTFELQLSDRDGLKDEMIDEPERKKPNNFVTIEMDLLDEGVPEHLVNFIHGEPVEPREVPVIAEELIQYLALHPGQFAKQQAS